MAYSYTRYTVGDNATVGQQTFDLTFTGPSPGYLDRSHVYLYLNGVQRGGAGGTSSSGFTWTTSTSVQLKDYSPVDADVLEFRRVIPKNTNYIEFANGALTSEDHLNHAQLAALYALHEAIDGVVIDQALDIELEDVFNQLDDIADDFSDHVTPITDFGSDHSHTDASIYFIDPTVTDQGTTTVEGNRSVKDFQNIIGSDNATLVFPKPRGSATIQFTFSTSVTLASNITIDVQPGARLYTAGSATLTLSSNSNIICGARQLVQDADVLRFSAQATVNVENFGTISPTTDSSSAILRAINAVAEYSTINISSTLAVGYSSWTGINITKDGITLKGAGRATGFKFLVLPTQTHTYASSTPAGILCESVEAFQLLDMKIDCNGLDMIGLALEDHTGCTIRGNEITGADDAAYTAHGIFAAEGRQNTYSYNYVHGNSGRGMWLGNINTVDTPERFSTISHNIVYDNEHSGIAGTHQYCTISNNVCTYNGDPSYAGSGIVSGSNATVQSYGNTITGNVCSFNGGQGIQMGDTGGTALTHGTTVSGNTCNGNRAHGIFASEIQDCVVTGNTCMNNNTAGASNGAGIVMYASVEGVAVTGNMCGNSAVLGTETQKHGIYFNGNDDQGFSSPVFNSVTITGNTCRNNLTNGIYVVQVSGSYLMDGMSITGNTCKDNGSQGIAIVDSTVGGIVGAVVAANCCKDNTTYDMRFDETIIESIYPSNFYETKNGADTENGFGYQELTGTVTISELSGMSRINSSGGAVTATLPSGTRYGQTHTAVMSNASNSSTLGVATHEDGSVTYTFDAVGETVTLMWSGYAWLEMKLSGATKA